MKVLARIEKLGTYTISCFSNIHGSRYILPHPCQKSIPEANLHDGVFVMIVFGNHLTRTAQ